MPVSTREANVRALLAQVAKHKLYEKYDDSPHIVSLDQRGAWTQMSVTCSCKRNWFLLKSDIEPQLLVLFDTNQEGRLVTLLNSGFGTLRWIMARVAPQYLQVKVNSRFDRDPPV